MKDFTVKDSGSRQEFDGGMVRDIEDGKPDMTHLFQHFEPMGTRYAEHMTKAATKYRDPEPGVPNWTLAAADPELVQRFKRSAARHFKQWLRGDTDEDHAAAVLFNLNGAEYVKAKIEAEDAEILEEFGYDEVLSERDLNTRYETTYRATHYRQRTESDEECRCLPCDCGDNLCHGIVP